MVISVINQNRARIAYISGISALAGAANIWLLAQIGRDAHLTGYEARDAVEFLAALCLMSAINFVSQIMLSRLSASTFFLLREQLVSGVTQLRPMQLESIGKHRLYTALTKDVPAIHDLLIVLPNYVFNFTVVLACLTYLATMSLKLFLVFVLFLVLALAVARFVIVNRAEKRFHARRKIEDDLFKCYEAIIDGNKELKLHARRKRQFVQGDLSEHARRYRDATLSAEFFWNMSNNWSAAVIFLGVGAVLFLSSHLGSISRAAVTVFIMVIFYMVGPLTILMNSFRTIHAAKVGFKRLADLQLTIDQDQPKAFAFASQPAAFDSLEVKGLSFQYHSVEEGRGGFKIGPFDLEIRRGEIVYFVGGNGSGKTTAAKLLAGLYEKESGSIAVNGIDVGDDRTYLQLFSAIFQDYYLFDMLVSKRDEALDTDDVELWIQRLCLQEKVSVSQGRLSTTQLSYGQRKRLALLVSLFDHSDIYILDEWAADQDQEFRQFFYREFLFALKQLGKTTIVISHDDRYFHLADKLVKFDAGKITSIVDKEDLQTQADLASDMVDA